MTGPFDSARGGLLTCPVLVPSRMAMRRPGAHDRAGCSGCRRRLAANSLFHERVRSDSPTLTGRPPLPELVLTGDLSPALAEADVDGDGARHWH